MKIEREQRLVEKKIKSPNYVYTTSVLLCLSIMKWTYSHFLKARKAGHILNLLFIRQLGEEKKISEVKG